jgi:glycosyltransferase involved in cell wall biosynthesis
MRIHLYANCWNEARMLPFFMRHYNSIVDKFIILDDGSTDGSIEYLKSQDKVRLIKGDREGASYIEQSRIFFNQAWKESRAEADWIITCNIDEHIYHKDLALYLHRCLLNGITILPAQGYEMISLQFPSTQGKLCDQVRLGARSDKLLGPSGMLTKVMAFNPRAIEDVSFSNGRHSVNPTGKVVYPSAVELKLLHYKFLGLDYAEMRYAELRTGLSSADIATGYGHQYTWNTCKIRRSYEAIIFLAEVVVSAGLILDTKLILTFLPLKTRLLFTGNARLLLIDNLFVRITKTFLNRAKKVLSSAYLER